MNFKNLANKAINFIADRLKELIGLSLSVISIFIGISLLVILQKIQILYTQTILK